MGLDDAAKWAEIGAAAGTVLALVVSISLFWRQLRDARREQARHVAAWLARQPVMIGYEPVGSVEVPVVVVANRSTEPIANVETVLVFSAEEEHDLEWLSFVAPEEEIIIKIPPKAIEVIDAVREYGFRDRDAAFTMVRFTDSAGRRWTRHPNGQLKLDRRYQPKAMEARTPPDEPIDPALWPDE